MDEHLKSNSFKEFIFREFDYIILILLIAVLIGFYCMTSTPPLIERILDTFCGAFLGAFSRGHGLSRRK